ncbi:MAG: OmpA family protein [Geminicoccales bacterium]
MPQQNKHKFFGAAGALVSVLALSASPAMADQAVYLTNEASYCEIFQAINPIVPENCREELGHDTFDGGVTRSIQMHQAPKAVSGAAKGNTGTLDDQGERAIAMNIQFEFDSSKLTLEALGTLDRVAEVLNSDLMKDKAIVVEGHTDSVGSDSYNFGLSTRRALAVQFYLTEQHLIDMDRLVISGKGELEPYDSADPKAALNRRVEFVNSNS